jgi:hypothetical protein
MTLPGGFLFLLPTGIELNRFGHEFVTQRFQVVRDLTAGLRQPATPVGGLDKIFFGFQRRILVSSHIWRAPGARTRLQTQFHANHLQNSSGEHVVRGQ